MKKWTVKDVAEYLALSERTIYNMVRSGKLPALKIGGVFRFDPKEIENWTQAKQYQAAHDRVGQAKQKNDDKILLDKIKAQTDTLTKRLLFVGLLTRKLVDQKSHPVIVGGNAVEFYTAGGYATTDIDIVYPSEKLAPVFKELGLKKEGRHWYNDEMGIAIEAPVSFLDPLAKDRVTQVVIDDLIVFIIGLEDLIIDRLNAFVHWSSGDDGNWAKELIDLHKRDMDWAYLEEAAKRNKVDSALKELKASLGIEE